MDMLEAREEYLRALKLGQKEVRELTQKGKTVNLQVLDELLGPEITQTVTNIGMVEIPADRIVGTKSRGRIGAFAPSFLPLLNVETEFAAKWISLCAAHLSSEGIRDPIGCYEYMGRFYVQEGNKRVSVLRYFDAPNIPGQVLRVLPTPSDEPEVRAYYEFVVFYESAKMYDVQFRRPGDYARLLSFLGKEPGERWDERERKTFRAYFHYFREAFTALHTEELDLLPEEGLLLWLQVHPFKELGSMSAMELKKSVAALWEDLLAISQEEPVQLQTEPDEAPRASLFSKLLSAPPEHLQVAFLYPRDLSTSAWAAGHEAGARYLQETLGHKVTVKSYFHADSQEQTERLLEQAVEAGAQVVFTTTPQMGRATLKAAVRYPKVRFLNCSLDVPYASVRTYYSRIFEGKFITGAIAGAMSDNNRIGYVGSYPIFGVPAAINAFALGAQMTNPRAKVELRWSCMEGQPVRDFMDSGIKVISNRDVPINDKMYLDYCDYGTYMVAENGELKPLGSPVWMWGKFYERVINTILRGGWDTTRDTHQAVNYWWGMDSGVIDVSLADDLPDGVRFMARMLRQGLRKGSVDPFHRRIVAQDGSVKNPGHRGFTPEELMHMDWLCENVEGFIPTFDQIQPISQPMVRELGIYRDQIPMEKEGSL